MDAEGFGEPVVFGSGVVHQSDEEPALAIGESGFDGVCQSAADIGCNCESVDDQFGGILAALAELAASIRRESLDTLRSMIAAD